MNQQEEAIEEQEWSTKEPTIKLKLAKKCKKSQAELREVNAKLPCCQQCQENGKQRGKLNGHVHMQAAEAINATLILY